MDYNRFFIEKEVVWINKICWACPTCGEQGIFPLSNDSQPNYCYKCGQKIKFIIKEKNKNAR